MRRTLFSYLFAVVALCAPAVLVAQTTAPSTQRSTQPTTQPISVTEFGAVGDGKTLNTIAIQRALNVASARGGGEVLIPPGNFMSGSLVVGSKTTLRLAQNAVLIGSSRTEDYPVSNVRWDGRWMAGHRALLSANNVEQIAIIGEGRIVGPSYDLANLRPSAETGSARGPILFEPIDCRDVLVEGITFQYQRMWSLHPTRCQNVTIRNVTVRSPTGPGLWGGGGIDIDSCQTVLLDSIDVETGDDAVVLRSGRGLDAAKNGGPTEDVIIRNSRLASPSYSSLSIGPELSGGVKNVRVEGGSLTRALHAVHIKGRAGGGGFIDGLTVEGTQIQGPIRTGITINLDNSGPVDLEPLSGDAAFPKVSNLSFNNIRVLATFLVVATETASEMPIENVTLSNFNGQSPEGIQAANIRNLTLKNIRLTGYLAEFVRLKAVTGPNIENIRAPRDTLEPGTTLPASTD